VRARPKPTKAAQLNPSDPHPEIPLTTIPTAAGLSYVGFVGGSPRLNHWMETPPSVHEISSSEGEARK
jgi:hypothetical protein